MKFHKIEPGAAQVIVEFADIVKARFITGVEMVLKDDVRMPPLAQQLIRQNVSWQIRVNGEVAYPEYREALGNYTFVVDAVARRSLARYVERCTSVQLVIINSGAESVEVAGCIGISDAAVSC